MQRNLHNTTKSPQYKAENSFCRVVLIFWLASIVLLILLCLGLFSLCCVNFIVMRLVYVVLRPVVKMSLCCNLFPLCCVNFMLRLVSVVLS